MKYRPVFEVFWKTSGWSLRIEPRGARVYFGLYWQDKEVPTHDVDYDLIAVLDQLEKLTAYLRENKP